MARMPLPNQRRHARKAPASASTAAASTVLEVDGLQLHVTRKRIKNLYLRIKPPLGTVEVSAPMRMSQRQIIGFAHERHSWIVQQQRRMAEARRMSLRQAETLTPLPALPPVMESMPVSMAAGAAISRSSPCSTVRPCGPMSANMPPRPRSMPRFRGCCASGRPSSGVRRAMSPCGS